MKIVIGLIAISLCICCNIFANEENFRKQYSQCIDKSEGITLKILNCNSDELKYQDNKLNQLYQTLLKKLSTDSANNLKISQKLWVQFRDAHCEIWITSGGGGTLDSINYSQCILTQTAARVSELQEFTDILLQ